MNLLSKRALVTGGPRRFTRTAELSITGACSRSYPKPRPTATSCSEAERGGSLSGVHGTEQDITVSEDSQQVVGRICATPRIESRYLRVIRCIGIVTLLAASAPFLLGQSEAELKRAFEGTRVTVKIEMPATQRGIDLHLGDAQPIDFRQYSTRIK
jgi:hypothetical protein